MGKPRAAVSVRKQHLPINKAVLPHQVAWLRRSELDAECGGYEVWEKPDGDLYLHNPQHGELVLCRLVQEQERRQL